MIEEGVKKGMEKTQTKECENLHIQHLGQTRALQCSIFKDLIQGVPEKGNTYDRINFFNIISNMTLAIIRSGNLFPTK